MTETPGPTRAAAAWDGEPPPDFTRAWLKALAGTCYVPLTRSEREAILRRLAGRLVAALVAEPFRATPAYHVGTALVGEGFASPEALSGTVGVISERLLTDLGGGLPGDVGSRQAALLGALVAGYTRALRDQTLDQQEEIRLAALEVRVQAEQDVREAEARFRRAVLYDRLTGLPNRAMVGEELDRVFAGTSRHDRVGLCVIGLDGLKAVNDSLGHRVGDEVLVTVARRLQRLADDGGHLVARVGGDEFALVVYGTTCTDDAAKVADRVVTLLAEPISVGTYDELPLSASAGVVERPVSDSDPTELRRAADIALHWAKADGRARWAVFDTARSARDVARYRLSAAMPGALARGEFTAAYQPLVDLTDWTVRGVEALARWHHPTQGVLDAGQFIDLAEDTGLIVPLGRHILELACRQAACWPGPSGGSSDGPFVSVNLSVRQLARPGLAAEIADMLERTSLPARRLHLEITESAVLRSDEAIGTLRTVAALGVRLAIDDFGTGYSNLAYLARLPVHEVKLAGEFVERLRFPDGDDPAAAAVVCALIALGRRLGLTVTAEGIETAEQARRLAEVGCDAGQGWYLGRPGPASQITSMITR